MISRLWDGALPSSLSPPRLSASIFGLMQCGIQQDDEVKRGEGAEIARFGLDDERPLAWGGRLQVKCAGWPIWGALGRTFVQRKTLSPVSLTVSPPNLPPIHLCSCCKMDK